MDNGEVLHDSRVTAGGIGSVLRGVCVDTEYIPQSPDGRMGVCRVSPATCDSAGLGSSIPPDQPPPVDARGSHAANVAIVVIAVIAEEGRLQLLKVMIVPQGVY